MCFAQEKSEEVVDLLSAEVEVMKELQEDRNRMLQRQNGLIDKAADAAAQDAVGASDVRSSSHATQEVEAGDKAKVQEANEEPVEAPVCSAIWLYSVALCCLPALHCMHAFSVHRLLCRRAVPCRVVSSRLVLCCVVSCRSASCRVVRVMSCRVVSCGVVSWCRVVLCCVLCCEVLCCVVLQHTTAQHNTTKHNTGTHPQGE